MWLHVNSFFVFLVNITENMIRIIDLQWDVIQHQNKLLIQVFIKLD